MKVKTLHDLFVHEIKDLYSVENQLLKALPQMVDAAAYPGLKQALQAHLAETQEQVQRLDELCEQYEIKSGGHKCKAMEGLILEGRDALEDIEDEQVRDAAIIAGCQRIEHYEIAGYGCARAFAEQLRLEEGARLLQLTMDEEKAADDKLTQLAVQHVNTHAEEAGAEG